MGWPRFAGSSIQRRIFSGFVALVTLVLGMSMAGQWQLREVKQVSQEILPQGQRAHRLQELGVALWSLEGTAQKVYIVDVNGHAIGNPITGSWNVVNDADWSNDGQRLVVQATTGAAVGYYYYDANGNFLAQPSFP